MKLDDLAAKLIKLDNDIKYLVSASRFDWYDDLSGIEDWEAVTEDPNKLQFMKEFIGVMRKLQDVSWTMDYLTKPGRSDRKAYKEDKRQVCIKWSRVYLWMRHRVLLHG